MSEPNRTLIADFADLFYTQRKPREAFERFVAHDYVQHNPLLGDGQESALAMLEPLFGGTGARFDVKRIIVDGDLAVIHLHGQPDPASAGVAVVDIYRIAGGKIVEHWDVVQPIPSDGANPRSMF